MAANKKATLSDVAKRVNVSVATASKALHDRPDVNPRTRKSVLQAARELHYVPNVLAQSLVSGRSNSIGLVSSRSDSEFIAPFLIGLEDVLSKTSTLITMCINLPAGSEMERNRVESMCSRNIDGLIVVNDRVEARQPVFRPIPDLPVVYAFGPCSDPDASAVVNDDVAGGRSAVEHLLSCGRKRIAVIAGQEDYKAAQDRLHGTLMALDSAGLRPAGPVRFGDWTADWGRSATLLLLDQNVEFDAVVCANDVIAIGCMDVLKMRGLSIPDDVAVVGHDDWQVVSTQSSPKLTTIRLDFRSIGAMAAVSLNDAIEGRLHHGVEYAPCQVIGRGSTLPGR